jgi:2-amino-4-hydroxy-6-hydroxymethyldihydropteridine diphosphokinase
MTERSRWLLVLGSNAADAPDRLDAALAALGPALRRTSARIDGEDIAGRGPRYLNQLVEVLADDDVDALRAWCKRIERAHGRGSTDAAVCALDIDVLGRLQGDAVQVVDDKPLAIPAVRSLLRAMGVGP